MRIEFYIRCTDIPDFKSGKKVKAVEKIRENECGWILVESSIEEVNFEVPPNLNAGETYFSVQKQVYPVTGR